MKKQIILFAILAFSINLIWEVSHSFLYDWNTLPLQNNIYYYIPRIIISTFGDLVFLTVIFAIASIKNKNLKWINKPSKSDYLLIIIFGLIIAIIIEVRASLLQKWSYSQLMPTIAGIGLTPLIQLAITSLIVLYFIKNN